MLHTFHNAFPNLTSFPLAIHSALLHFSQPNFPSLEKIPTNLPLPTDPYISLHQISHPSNQTPPTFHYPQTSPDSSKWFNQPLLPNPILSSNSNLSIPPLTLPRLCHLQHTFRPSSPPPFSHSLQRTFSHKKTKANRGVLPHNTPYPFQTHVSLNPSLQISSLKTFWFITPEARATH